MNVDFSAVELAQIVKMCEADNMADTVIAKIHHTALRAVQNFQKDVTEPPEPAADPREASQQWRSPI
jgi:hypothetical protein